MESWKSKTLIIGAIAGALTGIIAALLVIQKADQEQTQPKLNAGQGVKVGLGVLGVLKMLAELGSGK